MTKIVPAILAKSKEQYMSRLNVVRQLTDRFQVDIIDGKFVDNRTIGLDEVGRLTELKMDVHLMVTDPKPFVEKAITLNPNLIIIQFECGVDITPFIVRIKKSGLQAGVAINPETNLSKITSLKEQLDHVLLMSYPAGFSGQKFQPEVFDKLIETRKLFTTAEIGLDGGVTEKNAKKILQAGFDTVNINSALFEVDDPLNRYSEFLEYLL